MDAGTERPLLADSRSLQERKGGRFIVFRCLILRIGAEGMLEDLSRNRV